MSKKVLLFTGSGFPSAIGLGTTNQFKTLTTTLDDRFVDHAIKTYLEDGKRDDIEHVMGSLHDFTKNNSSLELEILKSLSIPGLNGGSALYPRLDDIGNILANKRNDAARILMQIKKGFFRQLTKFDDAQSVILYNNTFAELRKLFGTEFGISFFTTNYDLTFERSLEDESWYTQHDLKKVDSKFTANASGKSVLDINRNKFRWEDQSIEYIKLHGSLDWHGTHTKVSKSGVETVPDNPNSIVILYPGENKMPKPTVFSQLHTVLEERLDQCDAVVTIGFAFRDDVINQTFDRTLRNRKKEFNIYCICKGERKNLPSGSNIDSFCTYQNFHYIDSGVDLTRKGNILGLKDKIKKSWLDDAFI